MNFEMNSAGAFLAAVRTERKNKRSIHELAELPVVEAECADGFWCVKTFFSLDFAEKLFGKRDFTQGTRFKGNFYKCGDETEIPHFGMWSEINSEKPDFHRPEFFGDFVII